MAPPYRRKQNKKGTISRPFSGFVLLCLVNCFSRALGSAGAAIQALVSIDLIVRIAHADRFGRTLCCAGAAGNALVIDNVSHDESSICRLTSRSGLIVTQLSQKSITKPLIREYIL
jgi:hypothetical protein